MTIELPERLQGVERVRAIRTPSELHYTYGAGVATSRFLHGLEQGKILGEKCPVTGRVYVPPRGASPEVGLPTTEQVEVSDKGTLCTFCIVNVPFYGQEMEIPYVSGNILLDGSDLPIMHLLQEADVTKVRMGMRVEAVWEEQHRPTLETVKYFRPMDAPDADYETYREYV